MFPSVPYRSREELRQEAELFLRQYHPSGTIPLPIEEIIEHELHLEIRPIRNLRRDRDIDGFLSSDLATIFVDNSDIRSNTNRYRFTVAHEVGHLALLSAARAG